MSDEQLYTTWDDFEVLQKNTDLLRGIYAYGFEKPSPIQQKAMKPLMDGKDILAQAQSGTGKTGCFGIGALSRVDLKCDKPQIIILEPTRELAKQTFDVITSLSCMMKSVKCQLLIGGNSISNDKSNIETNKPQIVIGCPGRINDMIGRNYLNTSTISLIIVDEADEMLSVCFKEQVYNIFQTLPETVQIGLFSATFPPEIEVLSNKFMQNPIKILVKSDMLSLEGISQFYIAVKTDNDKFGILKDIFESISLSQCIIYCNSINRVQDLYDYMIHNNYAVCCLHSEMTTDERLLNYNEFKNGKYRVLISSNITARGIDIQQVSTVINYDIPDCVHNYLHRIGRSGRWGRKGVGINFVTNRDIKNIKMIEQYYNTEIKELPINWASSL